MGKIKMESTQLWTPNWKNETNIEKFVSFVNNKNKLALKSGLLIFYTVFICYHIIYLLKLKFRSKYYHDCKL